MVISQILRILRTSPQFICICYFSPNLSNPFPPFEPYVVIMPPIFIAHLRNSHCDELCEHDILSSQCMRYYCRTTRWRQPENTNHQPLMGTSCLSSFFPPWNFRLGRHWKRGGD